MLSPTDRIAYCADRIADVRDDLLQLFVIHFQFRCPAAQLARLFDVDSRVVAIRADFRFLGHCISPVSPGRMPATKFGIRSEEHTSELQSLMRISYDVFCLKKKK